MQTSFKSTTITRTTVGLPVDLAIMKAHLRVLHSDEDGIIQAYTNAAKTWVEQYCSIVLDPCTVIESIKPSKADEIFRLSVGLTATISGAEYIDQSGIDTPINSDDLIVSQTEPIRIMHKNGWDTSVSHVSVYYNTGYTTANMPDPIKIAIMLIVGDMYDNRQDSVKSLPSAAEHLLYSFRIMPVV